MLGLMLTDLHTVKQGVFQARLREKEIAQATGKNSNNPG